MILISEMSFGYDKDSIVLDSITLEELEPVIVGLWGRNGAGKTTLMKLLAGHEKPDCGQITIKGRTPYNNALAVQDVCYMQEDQPFSWLWTVKDALRFGKYYNPKWDQTTANRMLKEFQLEKSKKVAKLSKGMRSALQYTIGLASMADVTILDEPINGLDAGMRKILYETLLESHANNPRFIMVSTHHIDELQMLFEKLALLDQGKLVFYEQLDEVRINGVWLVGEQNNLEEYTRGFQILERHKAGGILKVLIGSPYHEALLYEARARGITVEKAGMQDYLLGVSNKEAMLA